MIRRRKRMVNHRTILYLIPMNLMFKIHVMIFTGFYFHNIYSLKFCCYYEFAKSTSCSKSLNILKLKEMIMM